MTFLKMPHLNEVIRCAAGARLDQFVNDGDSPDTPCRSMGYLNRIREMAMEVRS